MAIIKRATNLRIIVHDHDRIIVGGKYTQIAEVVVIESLVKDVTLSSPKKICSRGNKEAKWEE